MTIGVKYIAYPNGTGYGLTALAYVRALHNAGIAVWWQPWFLWGEPHLWTPADGLRTLPLASAAGGAARLADLRALIDACTRPIDYDTVICHTVPEEFARFGETGKRMLGITVWETDALPAHWPPLLDAMRALAVPSRMNAEVFRSGGVSRPIHVVPYIRRHAWSSAAHDKAGALRRELGIRDDHFVFYSIGAWDARKGLEALIATFAQTFAPHEPVTLLVKTSRSTGEGAFVESHARAILEDCARSSGRPRANVVVIPADDIGIGTIDAIHAMGDCYVSLSRGEGWGLGAFDAASLGKPVLITGWGGQLDYLGADYPGLVRYELTQVPTSWLPHATRGAPQRWAQPDLGHAATLMRSASARDSTLFAAAAALRESINQRFAEPVVVRQLLAAIDG